MTPHIAALQNTENNVYTRMLQRSGHTRPASFIVLLAGGQRIHVTTESLIVTVEFANIRRHDFGNKRHGVVRHTKKPEKPPYV